jgi:hypothetical protein
MGFQVQKKILTASQQQALSHVNVNEEVTLVEQNQWADEEEKNTKWGEKEERE